MRTSKLVELRLLAPIRVKTSSISRARTNTNPLSPCFPVTFDSMIPSMIGSFLEFHVSDDGVGRQRSPPISIPAQLGIFYVCSCRDVDRHHPHTLGEHGQVRHRPVIQGVFELKIL